MPIRTLNVHLFRGWKPIHVPRGLVEFILDVNASDLTSLAASAKERRQRQMSESRLEQADCTYRLCIACAVCFGCV